jgi:predicted DNA-binding transcriptional regulator AlpA
MPTDNFSMSAPVQADRLLNVRQVAAILGVSEKGLRQRIARGDAPPLMRLSERTIRFSERHLHEWIGRCVAAESTPMESPDPRPKGAHQ